MTEQPIVAPPLPSGWGDLAAALEVARDHKGLAKRVAELNEAHDRAEAAVKAHTDLTEREAALDAATANAVQMKDAADADRRELQRQLAAVAEREAAHGDLDTRRAELNAREARLVEREAEAADGLRRITRFNEAYRSAS